MAAVVEDESTLTDRYQTTVPATVRRVLNLSKRDKIRYAIRADGEVIITRAAAQADEDPVLERFLGFLARDIADHPERIQPIDTALVQRVQALAGRVDVNLDAPLSAEDE